MNSSRTRFNPVVGFCDIRVFQACTCDQRIDLTQVRNRYCRALGALRKCACFPFLFLPHDGGLCANQFCVHPLHIVTDSCDCIMAQVKTLRTHSSYHINLVAEPMEPIHAELFRLATELEAVKRQVQTECNALRDLFARTTTAM